MFRRLISLLLLLLAASTAYAEGGVSLRAVTASVEPDLSDKSEQQIYVRFDDEGRKSFAAFTSEHIGRQINIKLNGRSVSRTTTIRSPITGGVMVFNPAPADQAENMVRQLSSGHAAIQIELLP